MAKGSKTGGKDFKPGESGNPNGRPPLPADLKATRDMDQVEFERLARGLMRLTKAHLNELLKSPDTPAQVVMLARIIRSAMWSGDQKRLDFLMNRLVGRVDTKVQAGQKEKPQGRQPSEMSDEELEERGLEIAEKLRRGR
jgi:hypothetical protein